MKEQSKPTRAAVMRRAWELAVLPANDVVKLALLCPEDGAQAVDRLELSPLSEIRRGANGTLELRLVSRLDALRLLGELLAGGGEEGAAGFFRAMEKAAEHGGGH